MMALLRTNRVREHFLGCFSNIWFWKNTAYSFTNHNELTREPTLFMSKIIPILQQVLRYFAMRDITTYTCTN